MGKDKNENRLKFQTELGKKIAILRDREKLSLHQLAKEAETCPASIMHWEDGTRCPSAYHLVRIAKALEISVGELCNAEVEDI